MGKRQIRLREHPTDLSPTVSLTDVLLVLARVLIIPVLAAPLLLSSLSFVTHILSFII